MGARVAAVVVPLLREFRIIENGAADNRTDRVGGDDARKVRKLCNGLCHRRFLTKGDGIEAVHAGGAGTGLELARIGEYALEGSDAEIRQDGVQRRGFGLHEACLEIALDQGDHLVVELDDRLSGKAAVHDLRLGSRFLFDGQRRCFRLTFLDRAGGQNGQRDGHIDELLSHIPKYKGCKVSIN